MIIINIMKKLAIFVFLVASFILVQNTSSASAFFDPTFGTNGKTITTFGHDAAVNALAQQPGGKALLAGSASNGTNADWAIVRYDTDGIIDPTFGINGIVKREFGNNDGATSIAVQEDEKILIGGYSGPGFTWVLARYNMNGDPDIGFGFGGINSLPLQGIINSLIILPDDKILAIGYFVGISGHDDVALVRYNSDGTLDLSFGSGGKVVTSIGSGNDRGKAAVLQPDGKIVVFGDFAASGGDDVFLVRFNSDGTLDNTFGTSGKVTENFEFLDGANGVVLQPDGKILITGGTFNGSSSNTFVARYNSDGTLDATFGSSGGKILTSFSSSNDSSNSIALRADGKIILGGYESASAPSERDFALRRFNSDGTLDTTFGTNGSIVDPIGSGNDEIQDILLQDNKIIATGNTHNGFYNDWAIARFVTSIDDVDLNVSLLKQTDPLWGSDVYNFANRWARSNSRDISAWGCALTSAAMVFQYHNINRLPDDTDLDPGTLNTWLKVQPDGYVGNGFVNWLALSRLSREAKSNNPDFDYDALEYRRTDFDSDQLTEDLGNDIPGILQVPGHFVVGKGIDSLGKFIINDPYFDRSSLSDYSDTFSSLGRFIPTNTDLSYMMLVVNEEIDINLTDEDSNSVGESYTQEPIHEDGGDSTNSYSLKFIYYPVPPDGRYDVNLSSNENQRYTLTAYLYNTEGEVFVLKFRGIAHPGRQVSIPIYFSEDSIFTIDSLRDLLGFYHSEEEMGTGTFLSLSAKLEVASKLSLLSKEAYRKILQSMLYEVSAQKGKGITEDAANTLSEAIQYLINSI